MGAVRSRGARAAARPRDAPVRRSREARAHPVAARGDDGLRERARGGARRARGARAPRTSATRSEAPARPFRASIAPPAVERGHRRGHPGGLARAARARGQRRAPHPRAHASRAKSRSTRRARASAWSTASRVFSAGDVEFGQPMRITAVVGSAARASSTSSARRSSAGASTRRASRSCAATSARMFGQERPLSLRAQLAFEQSYGEIDGDSASSSELFAVLSALADVGDRPGHRRHGQREPARRDAGDRRRLREDRGLLRPVQGARADGHAGRAHAAREPAAPRPARRRRRARSRDGQFHLYAVEMAAQGIEVLTGLPAGRARRERALPGVERLRPGRAPDHRDRRAAARGRGPRIARGRRVARRGRDGRRDRGRRAHPRAIVTPRRSARGPFASYDSGAMRSALAASFLLLASGCAGGSLVERAYDGHVVLGRAIEPEAYAEFLAGAMAESSGQEREALAAYERAARLDSRGPEIWTRVGAVRCALRPSNPGVDDAFARALALTDAMPACGRQRPGAPPLATTRPERSPPRGARPSSTPRPTARMRSSRARVKRSATQGRATR